MLGCHTTIHISATRLVKCFVKDESYMGYKHPRGIYARVDDCKIFFGPWFKVIEKVVYSLEEFIKHVPVSERPKYLDDRTWQELMAVGSDFTAYESHFHAFVIELECIIYRWILQNIPGGIDFVMAFFCVATSINKCVFRRFIVWILASRMSGEMNTSLGNGLVNLLLYEFNNEEKKNKYWCCVEGDDLIGQCSPHPLAAEDYFRLGFNIKFNMFNSVSEASFCGLIYDTEDLVGISDPTKVLLSVGWTSGRYATSSMKTRAELLRAKGYSILAQYPGAPILQSLGLMILRVTDGHHWKLPTTMTNYDRKHFTTVHHTKPVPFRTRLLMERVFGYSVAEQEQLEVYLDSLKTIQPLDHPVIDGHTSQEQRDYCQRFVGPLAKDGVVVGTTTTREQFERVVDDIVASSSQEELFRDVRGYVPTRFTGL